MEHTKKMALVPHQLVSSLLAQQHLNPNIAQLNSLDQQMKAILDDTGVPADLKYKQYNQVLRQYINVRDQELRPTPVPIQEISTRSKRPDILEGIPKTHKATARLLLRHIEDTPEIEWNDKQELVIQGNTVPGSNIVDLIHDFSRPRKTVRPATGWHELSEALKKTNVSREAVANKWRLQDEPRLAFVTPEFSTPASSTKKKKIQSTPGRKLRSNPRKKTAWSPY